MERGKFNNLCMTQVDLMDKILFFPIVFNTLKKIVKFLINLGSVKTFDFRKGGLPCSSSFLESEFNERRSKIILHARIDQRRHSVVVAVMDNSGNKMIKGKNTDFLCLEMVETFRPHSAKWVKAYPNRSERGKSGLPLQFW